MRIVVIAWNRPRYLYVMLDSLFAARGIERYAVSVYFDGGIDAAMARKQLDTVSGFHIEKVIFHRKNLGCLQSHVYAIKSGFDDGADEVLYLEDDFIVRPDLLEYLATTPRDANFYSLFGSSEDIREDYCPMGNLIPRETFYPLHYWIQAKKYIGTERPGNGYILGDTKSHDAVFNSYLVLRHLTTRFPKVSYTAHFGLSGLNQGEMGEMEKRFEENMFTGDRAEWLPRIVRILETREIPEEVNSSVFLPARFNYV